MTKMKRYYRIVFGFIVLLSCQDEISVTPPGVEVNYELKLNRATGGDNRVFYLRTSAITKMVDRSTTSQTMEFFIAGTDNKTATEITLTGEAGTYANYVRLNLAVGGTRDLVLKSCDFTNTSVVSGKDVKGEYLEIFGTLCLTSPSASGATPEEYSLFVSPFKLYK